MGGYCEFLGVAMETTPKMASLPVGAYVSSQQKQAVR